MCTLVYCIGIGSSLFHTFANLSTMALDVIPIGLYIVYYLWHWNNSIMRHNIKTTSLVIGVWLASTIFMTVSFKNLPLNGSQSYLSIALFLPWMAYQQKALFAKSFGPQIPPYHSLLKLGSVVFIVSLLFRSFDASICPFWQYGTHFLWHLFNGILLFLTTLNSIEIQKFLMNRK